MSDAATGRDELATQDTVVDVWRRFFLNWPEGVPRSGVLVTSYSEQVPFNGFLTTSDMVLLDRRHPDTTGARKVLIPYHTVDAVKFTDVLTDETFLAAGFQGGSSARAGGAAALAKRDDSAADVRATESAGEPAAETDGGEPEDATAGGEGLASAKYLAEQIKRQKEQKSTPGDTAPVQEEPKEEEKPRVKLPAWALRR